MNRSDKDDIQNLIDRKEQEMWKKKCKDDQMIFKIQQIYQKK